MGDEIPRYVFSPLAPFPKRWRDKYGPIRVMCDPVKGYVMCRRPASTPFVLHVSQLTNATAHPSLGPFMVEGVRTTKSSV